MASVKYSQEHEWIRVEGDVGTIGITQYAQEQLGDVVFVEVPQAGSKVAKGEANEEEKKKLAGLFAALHEAKPPKGEAASWDAKTKALVDAANDVLAGKEGAADKLKAAANCMECHKAHKG